MQPAEDDRDPGGAEAVGEGVHVVGHGRVRRDADEVEAATGDEPVDLACRKIGDLDVLVLDLTGRGRGGLGSELDQRQRGELGDHLAPPDELRQGHADGRQPRVDDPHPAHCDESHPHDVVL